VKRFIVTGIRKTLCLVSAVVSLTATVASSAPAEPQAPAEIKIGFLNSITGLGATAGQQMLKGMNLALDQYNHKMAGHDVRLLVEDDESSPTKAIVRFRKLVDQDHVDLICGMYFSTVAYAAAPLADKEHIPCIVGISGADNLTQRKASHWVLRTSFTASQSTHPFGEYAAKILHYKRIITVGVDYGYGHESVGGFQTGFEKSGGQVVQKLWLSMDSKDFTPLIKQMRKDADAVFMSTSGQAADIFPKQYNLVGPKLPVIASSTSCDESSFSKVGLNLIDVQSTGVYSTALDTAANSAFVKQYSAKYNEDPGFYSECGYVCGMWIKKAVESLKGNTNDKEKLLAALRKVELSNAPRGPIKLDEYGNPIENVYIRKVASVNGRLQNTVIKTYPKVSQFWKSTPAEYLANPPYSKEYPPCTHCN